MENNIIITGATGYIGGHVALKFKQEGYRVIGIDRTVTIPAAVEYLDEFLCTDYADIVDTCAALNNSTAIIHCAGTSLVGPSLTDPGEYYNNNTAKTNKMLNWLARKGWCGSIIFSSSAAIYGNNPASPLPESAAWKVLPMNPYGWSKLLTEQILQDHCTAHGFRGIALRYFNAAGCDPQGRLGCVKDGTHLITKIANAALTGTELIINGNDYRTRDGTCIRDYIHVTDLADAHYRAVKHAEESMREHAFVSFNVGTGIGLSNKEVLDQFELSSETSITWRYGPRREGDPDILVSDPSHFKITTGWEARHSDIDSLSITTFNWMKKTYYNV